MNESYLRELEAHHREHPLASLPTAKLSDIEVTQGAWTPELLRETYDRWGCVLIRDMLTDLIPALTAATEAMAQAVRDADYASRYNALIIEGGRTARGKQIMLFTGLINNSAAHLRAVMDSRLHDALEALIGPDVELYGNGMQMYKEPGGGMEKALHQDAPYFYHRDHTFCTAFLHMVPTTHENGCLHVIPGSHKLGLQRHIDTFSHLAVDPAEFPLSAAIPIYGQPGDLVLFNYLTIHGSDINGSERPRPAFCMQFRSPHDVRVWEGAATVDRLGIPAKPDTRPPGIMIRGQRPAG